MSKDLQLLLSFMEPIRELLLDDSITEIMGNPDGTWWFERSGKLLGAEGVTFELKKLLTGLNVIANKLGKKFDEANPFLRRPAPGWKPSRGGKSTGCPTQSLGNNSQVF